MTINTQRYIRKPLYVDAVQVTEDNFYEVAHWCNGDIATDNPQFKERMGSAPVNQLYIRVRVHSPQSDRQKQAHIGDWVLYNNRGYKIYTDRAFQNSFDEEPSAAFKRAVDELKETWREATADARKHFRGGPNTATDAICNVCGSPKGSHAIGQMCNNNCGGTVVANPNLERQL